MDKHALMFGATGAFAVLALSAVVSGCAPRAADPTPASTTAARPAPFDFPPDGVAVLGEIHGAMATSQCSRRPVEGVTGYWLPTLDQARAADSVLFRVLRDERTRTWRMPEAASDRLKYYRQYVGLVRRGERVLYVNGFSARPRPGINWREQPITYCDGGTGFFGAIYEPHTSRIVEFRFNAPEASAFRTPPGST